MMSCFNSMNIRTAVGGLHEYYSSKRYHPLVDIICAPILLVIALSIASIGPIATTITLLFFLSWSVSSLVILICVFELEVVPYLEILFSENFVLISLTTLSVSQNYDNDVIYNHWIRSAVSHRFYMVYVLSQVLVLIALVYGSQLTLTTICHSRLLYRTILIPDDCSDVYFDVEYYKSVFYFGYICAVNSVVPYLEILFSENFVLISLTTLSVSQNYDNDVIYNHWIRSAVSHRFYMVYVLSQVLVLIALVYGSQLTLTTICHSRLLYRTILIPDDCSDVYFDVDIKI
ncbi:unnamed protein product [Medioppia subpectinata]|uniref:Uncharacterized protein n=1 Tax=Medioppia subpectinata TaxID=1979941 RepID=A0A7R9KYX5_9ACAR|nr:unnamed protein product [Medioppia subpectinata]CAG2112462.1 unnamed protein product [Medioppia subpectinata]